jgi:glyoxylase-like metal-dependent hydrolase (beta-lactamase superfamily II)
VAEGATVITEDKNREFYKNVVLAPQSRTLLPDRLSQRPFAPTGPGQLMLQTYSDSYTISDGNQTIELHVVEGLNHTDNMTIAYLPKQKLLVSADMGGPPPAGSPAPANVPNNSIVLYNNIKRLKLDVVTHAPIHGPTGPQAEFDRIVGPAAARAPQQGGGG